MRILLRDFFLFGLGKEMIFFVRDGIGGRRERE